MYFKIYIFRGTPVVAECEGMYEHDSRKNRLVWKLPVIDSSNKTGSMEFSCSGKASDFFPVTVEFESVSSYCNIKVRKNKARFNQKPSCKSVFVSGVVSTRKNISN